MADDKENILGQVNSVQKPRLNIEYEKKLVSKVFTALAVMALIMLGAQLAVDLFTQWKFPDFYDTNRYLWLSMFISQYLLAYPIAVFLIGRNPEHIITEHKISAKEVFLFFVMCYSLVIAGNFIGMGFNGILEFLFGIDTEFAMDDLLLQSDIMLVFVVAVIMGPFAEELIFRKMLLDRLVKYGELQAVIASALIFGLFHGNFSQFFYAVMVGFVLGYVYVKTGKLRYSFILHMGVNFCGSVLPSVIMDCGNDTAMVLYMLFEVVLFIAGLALLWKNRRGFFFNSSDYAITDKEGRIVIWKNKGAYFMITCFVFIFFLGMF